MTPVLDHGHVKLLDAQGGDLRIVQDARVSYAAEAYADERDERLIRYLMRHQHGTPFEGPQFRFEAYAPIFIARQWMRHRTLTFNEVSGRYVALDKPEFYLPKVVRVPGGSSKQGSVEPNGDSAEWDRDARCELSEAYKDAAMRYRALIRAGVANEHARLVLPQATYTLFRASGNLRAWMHWVALRRAPGAQAEHREYAEAVWRIIGEHCPITHREAEAFWATQEHPRGI